MEIVLVVARAGNGVIGRDGGLPWRLPADLRRFRALTMGRPMLMGRRTFDSLPGVLPGRRHLVLTRDAGWRADGAEPVCSIAAALAAAEGAEALMVIGGAELFALALPLADRMELTEVHADVSGDTVMPPPDAAHWREVAREEHPAVGDAPAHAFVTLERRGLARLHGSRRTL